MLRVVELSSGTKRCYENMSLLELSSMYQDSEIAFVCSDGHLTEIIFE